MILLENFNTVETLKLAAVGTGGSSGNFVAEGKLYEAIHCRIVNTGNAVALVMFKQGSAPTVPNANPYGKATVVEPGADLIINKGMADYFAAITESGTTDLWFSAGYGT